MFPEDCIIYDSRVVYSLNWILLPENASDVFFPIPEGRNSKMMAFDMSTLIHLKRISEFHFTGDDIPKKHISATDGKIFIAKDRAFQQLNMLIKEVHRQLWKGDESKQKKLFYTEMLLFSIADNIVFKDILDKGKFSIK
jgi:hypothetical protein